MRKCAGDPGGRENAAGVLTGGETHKHTKIHTLSLTKFKVNYTCQIGKNIFLSFRNVKSCLSYFMRSSECVNKEMLLTTVLHPNLGVEKSGVLSYVPVKFHGVCLFFLSRSGSRLSGSGGGMCTSGEESSVELSSCAQLDTDEQQSSEEWLVRSKAPQLKSRISRTDSEYQSGMICVPEEGTLVSDTKHFSTGYNLIEYYNCLQHVTLCLCAHNLKEYEVLTNDKPNNTLKDCCFQMLLFHQDPCIILFHVQYYRNPFSCFCVILADTCENITSAIDVK